MERVGLLTGAPAAGKTSLLKALMVSLPELETVNYGQWLLDTIRQSRPMEYRELRELSSQVITPELVSETDARVVDFVRETRAQHPILIDSHAVTKERYGFRVVPFAHEHLRDLDLDFIVCLYCTPEETIRRIRLAPEGRSRVSERAAFQHSLLQASLANSYGAVTGIPVYHLDSTDSGSIPLAKVEALLGN